MSRPQYAKQQQHTCLNRRAINDVFESMERDALAPWGMASRVPTIGFPSHRGGGMFPAITRGGFGDSDFGVHLDFHETSAGFEMTADLPGMKKEDITVDVDNESGVLTVSGERKMEKEESSGGGEEGERK